MLYGLLDSAVGYGQWGFILLLDEEFRRYLVSEPEPLVPAHCIERFIGLQYLTVGEDLSFWRDLQGIDSGCRASGCRRSTSGGVV